MSRSTHSPSRRSLLQAALAAGAAPLFVRHALAADQPRFALGVASGFAQPDGIVLWTLVSGEGLPAQVAVDWEMAQDEAFTRVQARGREWAVPEDAYSVHAEAAGLAPDRWYWYRFTALGQRSPVGRTRTAPARGAEVDRLRFAIASCQRYDHGRYAAWADCARRELDFVFFLGDYIYENATPADRNPPRRHEGPRCELLSDYRRRHAQYKSDPHLQAAHAGAPWFLIWDDHDIENDWAGNVSERLTEHFERQRAAAAKAYWEHLPFPKSRRPDAWSMLINERYDWGALARIIAIDDRQWRDQQVCPKPGRGGGTTVSASICPEVFDPKRTMLGPAQEQWLAAQWDASKPWNLLAQQTLMAGLNWEPDKSKPPTIWTDGWDGYPEPRRRLLADLAARDLPNTVVLGGDVHANFVADLRVTPEGPIVATEFCGTSITSEGMRQSQLDQALPHNPQLHYGRSEERGYASFELTPGGLTAELRTVNEIWRDDSPVETAARFFVEAGRPGAQRA
ncbi:MAG: alkaline phosphatase D family protein [Paucibacter sp.]|nr:alkaline phosphatase D family protein [Roseateles sp.]